MDLTKDLNNFLQKKKQIFISRKNSKRKDQKKKEARDKDIKKSPKFSNNKKKDYSVYEHVTDED